MQSNLWMATVSNEPPIWMYPLLYKWKWLVNLEKNTYVSFVSKKIMGWEFINIICIWWSYGPILLLQYSYIIKRINNWSFPYIVHLSNNQCKDTLKYIKCLKIKCSVFISAIQIYFLLLVCLLCSSCKCIINVINTHSKVVTSQHVPT